MGGNAFRVLPPGQKMPSKIDTCLKFTSESEFLLSVSVEQ